MYTTSRCHCHAWLSLEKGMAARACTFLVARACAFLQAARFVHSHKWQWSQLAPSLHSLRLVKYLHGTEQL
jgi:hypothetical protein